MAETKDSTEGKPITCYAAVAYGPPDDIRVEKVVVAPPKQDEVRVQILFTGVCHTDKYTLSGQDGEGGFPQILGHEGIGVVESVGAGVTDVAKGDLVIPLYTAQCYNCVFCKSEDTNLCSSVRKWQGQGLLPDVEAKQGDPDYMESNSVVGSVRFTDASGALIRHYMGTSTFAQYSTMHKYSVAKVTQQDVERIGSDETKQKSVCLLGCGVTTGFGAARKTMKTKPGSKCAVFGLGGVGLSVVQGLLEDGHEADLVICIDADPKKEAIVLDMLPEHKRSRVKYLHVDLAALRTEKERRDWVVEQVKALTHPPESNDDADWGVDYSFEAIGMTETMRTALEICHKGWGKSCIIGVAPSGAEISTRPFQLVTGRSWHGTAFGGYKSRQELPSLVSKYLDGKLEIDKMVTDTLPLSTKNIREAFSRMAPGAAKPTIRTVMDMRNVIPSDA